MLRLLLVLLLVSAMFWVKPWEIFQKSSSDGIITSKTASPSERKISVLFIGNSYTSVNDLPRMVTDIASSDPGNRILFEVQSVVQGGAHLIDLWDAGTGLSVIKSRHWDYVVLQDQSEWAMFASDINTAYEAGDKFASEIRHAGAVPLLYLTWMRQPGSSWYTDPETAFMKNPEYMQMQLHDYTNVLARRINATVIPVGDVWAGALRHTPSLHLYNSDGSHPSATGTYLGALLFYHYFTSRTVEQVTYQPAGADASEAAYLRQIVSQ